jgi:transcriptional regulator with XRE-family HTH domain
MVRRYEAGETQPTLEVIRNMARALSVSADALVFEQDERNPVDDLRLQFEAVSQLPPEEQSVVMEVLESLIIKYQGRRWDKARAVVAATKAPAKAAPAKKMTHAGNR